jgi:hypothetical protein
MNKFADVQPQDEQAAHKFGVSLEETASFNIFRKELIQKSVE